MASQLVVALTSQWVLVLWALCRRSRNRCGCIMPGGSGARHPVVVVGEAPFVVVGEAPFVVVVPFGAWVWTGAWA